MLRCRAINGWRLPVPQRTSFRRLTSRPNVPRIPKTRSAHQVAGPHATTFRGVHGGKPRNHGPVDLVADDPPGHLASSRRSGHGRFALTSRVPWNGAGRQPRTTNAQLRTEPVHENQCRGSTAAGGIPNANRMSYVDTPNDEPRERLSRGRERLWPLDAGLMGDYASLMFVLEWLTAASSSPSMPL
jgi:hypothetical protein